MLIFKHVVRFIAKKYFIRLFFSLPFFYYYLIAILFIASFKSVNLKVDFTI